MSTVKKILLFAVGLILVVGFIAIGLIIFNKAKSNVSNASTQYDSLVSQYDDVEYALYDGGTASGAEVVDLIKALERKEDGVTIIVYTKENLSYTPAEKLEFKKGATTYAATLEDATRRVAGNDDYINPTASFSGKVTRDANNIITTVTFTQK